MSKESKKWFYLIPLFFVALFAILYFTGVLGGIVKQSVISPPSNVQFKDGTVYWSATVNANDINEGVGFNFVPSPVTLTQQVGSYPVNTKVTPKDSVVVYFSKSDNFCTYQLTPSKASAKIIGISSNYIEINYFELLSPQRTFNVIVCADSDCKTIDATTPGNRLTFFANGGSLVVSPQGALVGKSDCPSANNVGLYFKQDGTPIYFNEAKLIADYQNSWKGWAQLFGFNLDNYVSKVDWSYPTFIAGFSSSPSIDPGRTFVKGLMSGLSFGTGQILLTADAKYFNSAFVVPPTACKPSISSLNVNDISQGSSGTAALSLSADKDCTLYVSASTTRSSVSPSSTNIVASTSKSNVNFLIECNVGSGGDSLNVKVCSGNDYTGNTNCVSKSESFNCVQSKPSGSYCGDGKCDSSIGESSNTCIADCPLPPQPNPTPTTLDCSKYSKLGGLIPSNPVTTSGESCVLGFIACKPQVVNTCQSDYSLVLILGVLLIFALVVVYFVSKGKGKGKGGSGGVSPNVIKWFIIALVAAAIVYFLWAYILIVVIILIVLSILDTFIFGGVIKKLIFG